MKVWVVIPAYNESASLAGLLDQLCKKKVSIFVVDDGSTDDTYALAGKRADLAIRNARNRGKGVVVREVEPGCASNGFDKGRQEDCLVFTVPCPYFQGRIGGFPDVVSSRVVYISYTSFLNT